MTLPRLPAVAFELGDLMPDTFISDMTHCLDESGSFDQLPGPARRLAEHVGAIVAAMATQPVDAATMTAVSAPPSPPHVPRPNRGCGRLGLLHLVGVSRVRRQRPHLRVAEDGLGEPAGGSGSVGTVRGRLLATTEGKPLTEGEWVELVADRLKAMGLQPSLSVRVGLRIPYGLESRSYGEDVEPSAISFQTDLAVIETDERGRWKPRVIIEAKLGSITTHGAITYSQKAASHKAVHPYLRYGVMLGDRQQSGLPGRLYRHGAHFDFMMSFASTDPSDDEMARFRHLLEAEVEASRSLEKVIYESRRRNRVRHTLLHRRLDLE